MKKYFLSVSLLTCFSIVLNAQEATIEAANKLYDAKAYSDAIGKYEKVLKKDSSNTSVLGKLADCYRMTNNNNGELVCYGKLVKDGKAEDMQKFYYGRALMTAGKYDDAKRVLDEVNSDSRAKSFAKSIGNIAAFSKNEDAYKVDSVTFNSEQNDFAPVFYRTPEMIVFTSSRNKTAWINKKHSWTDNSYFKVYVTEKSEGMFKKPKSFMRDLDSKYNNGPVSFSKDGNTVYFTRNTSNKKTDMAADGTFKLKTYEAKLNEGGFEKVTELPFNSKESNVVHPSVSPDGSTLYFASDMNGTFGGMDIWMSKRGADGVWGEPVNMGSKVNTKGNEVFPFITADNLLYYASDGQDGLGGLDIFEAKIKDGKAGKSYNMGKPINSGADDFGLILTEDGKSGYLSSNRKKGGEDDDIYKFDVLRVVKRGKTMNLILKDKDSGELLANAHLQINADSMRTNDKGEYQMVIEEDVDYRITASKTKYFEAKDSANTKSVTEDEFTKTITLEKDPNLSLLAFILDAKSNQALEGVKISIKDNAASAAFDTYTTTTTGDYRKSLKGKKIGDKIDYQIVLEKPGYLSKTVNWKYDITKEGEIKMNELLTLTIGKVEVGMDLAKMIDMKPIYFDVGKSKIRPDAAIELDKVVSAMKQYPDMIIELGSHTDCRSAAAANMKLSTARAKASAAYITGKGKGIDKKRITGKGYGETKLLNGCACEGKVATNCTEDEHAKNRRTEFIIVKLK